MASLKSTSKKKKFDCILLVDDDPIANYLHLRLLNNSKLAKRIDIVTNGAEALIYLKEICHPEILFLDINMPVMDGTEFLINYKRIEPLPKTRIIILSTSEHTDDLSFITSLGINDYLIKPLREEKVMEILNI
ncbi:response regulator [soil metagenome]